MQVQHEASLIEPDSSAKLSNNHANKNKSLDSYCLQFRLSNSMSPIEHLATSPSGSSVNLLACHVSQTNQILLFDTQTRKRRDKFPLKAYDKKYSRQSFQLSGIDFSPDGQRLAIGQTDCIIYVYRLTSLQAPSSSGNSTTTAPVTTTTTNAPASLASQQNDDQSAVAGLKPTITGKFAASSPITCMRWSELGIIFGSQDGRVRLILSFNKSSAPMSNLQTPPQSDTLGQSLSGSSSNHQPAIPSSSSSQAPKVMNLFTVARKGSMPISLAYRNSILLIGQSDCSVAVIQLAAGGGSPSITTDNVLALAGGVQQGLFTASEQGSQQQQQQLSLGATQATFSDSLSTLIQGSSSSSRRSSSISVQNLGTINSTTFNHSCPPVHITIIQTNPNTTTTICCSGSDGRVAFHQLIMQPMQQQQQQQLASQASGKVFAVNLLQAIDVNEDIMSMDYSSVNEVLALATKSRLVFIKYDQEASSWRLQSSTIELRNVFTLATLKWLRDGGHLVVGCSSGCLELFKCVWSKQSVNDKLDICHIARNRIRITDRERNLLATYKTQADIKRVNLLDHGQSVLIHTSNTLLLAKLCNQRLQSEIKWAQSAASSDQQKPLTKASMKFLFDPTSSFVIILDVPTNELSLLKLGNDFVTFSVRFSNNQLVKRDWLSVGQFPPAGQQSTPLSASASSLSPTTNRLKATSRNSSASTHRSQQHRHSSSLTGLVGDGINGAGGLTSTDEAIANSLEQPVVSLSSGGGSGGPAGRVFELFAYVTGGDTLHIVDLLDSNRVIYSERHSEPIEWIRFSRTSRYLVFQFASQHRQLNLLRIRPDHEKDDTGQHQSQHQNGELQAARLLVDKSILLERCEGRAHWLPESDSLVAQSGPIIHLWYDLDDRERCNTLETYDSRSFNFLNKKPLVDLSLLAMNDRTGNGGSGSSSNHHHPILVRVTSNGSDSQLVLSNGQVVTLSKVKTSFYAKLASGSLEAALELLDSQKNRDSSSNDSGNKQIGATMRPLYSKLGWLALEREGKCELAWRVFSKLRYSSLAKYLEKCLSASEEVERELMLAKLRADWMRFEQLAQDQEMIVATYRRLNKWLLLIDYLTRGQQFRQRDLAQHDHLEWLIKAGRHREAAELKVRDSGDLTGALELLLSAAGDQSSTVQNLEAAADLLLKEQRLPLLDVGSNNSGSTTATKLGGVGLTLVERKLRDLVESEIRDKLIELGAAKQLCKAAEVSERILGEPNKALALYLKAEAFEAALGLANRQTHLKDRVMGIELQYANYLRDQFIKDPLRVSAKRAVNSIDHYLRAGFPLEALKMANLLRRPDKGYKILIEFQQDLNELKESSSSAIGRDINDNNSNEVNKANETPRDEVLDECRKLGWQFLSPSVGSKVLEAEGEKQDSTTSVRRWQKALKAFEMGEDYEQATELLVELLSDFKRAFEICLEHVNGGDRRRTEEQFVGLARVWGQSLERAKHAEELFILTKKPELAIEMYEQLGEHDTMLELVEQYQSDQLEGRLLQLAKWLESCGRLEEAEKYLLRASQSEWTNVVRMYRLAERWPDAYRVARSNCISERDPLLVQLAYWWAKSIKTTDDTSSSNNSNAEGQRSRDLAPQDSTSVHRARRSLLRELGVLRQVVEFCCETKNFQFALELLDDDDDEQEVMNNNSNDGANATLAQPDNEQKARREVVLRYATFLEQQHKFEQAERLLVENNLIELAVKMYTDNDDYTSAIRLIEGQMSAGQMSGAAGAAGSTAISGPNQQDHQRQEPVAAASVALAAGTNQQRLVDLLNKTLVECARQLVEGLTIENNRSSQLLARAARGDQQRSSNSASTSERLQMAQQMFLRAQRPELAIEMYRSLGMWREAIMVAQRFAPRLLESVERALDEQVNDDIEPILRQTQNQANKAPAATGQSSPDDVDDESKDGDMVATDRKQRQRRASKSSTSGRSDKATPTSQTVETPVEVRIWRQFEACVVGQNQATDQGAARALLDEYLGVLTAMSARGECLSSRQMRPLERFLFDMRQQRSALVSSILSQANITWRLMTLADELFASESGWSGSSGDRSGHEVRSSWLSLRNILASYAKLVTGSPIPTDDPQLERRVLVAHYVTLHCSLTECLRSSLQQQSTQNNNSSTTTTTPTLPARQQTFDSLMNIKQMVTQVSRAISTNARGRPGGSSSRLGDIVDLLAKISFALLRYTDLLEPSQVLWVAGLWQLGQNRRQATRLIWATLVELADQAAATTTTTLASDNTNNNNNSSIHQRTTNREAQRAASELIGVKLGAYVDVPEYVRLETSKSRCLPVQRLNQVRQWLLETLIEGGNVSSGDQSSAALPTLGWSCLRPTTTTTTTINAVKSAPGSSWWQACRVSGLPVVAPTEQAEGRAPLANANTPNETPFSAPTTTNALRREELFKLISLCEIESDKLPAAAAGIGSGSGVGGWEQVNMEQLKGLIGEIGARRRGQKQQTSRPRQLTTAQDHLIEIVEFILDS